LTHGGRCAVLWLVGAVGAVFRTVVVVVGVHAVTVVADIEVVGAHEHHHASVGVHTVLGDLVTGFDGTAVLLGDGQDVQCAGGVVGVPGSFFFTALGFVHGHAINHEAVSGDGVGGEHQTGFLVVVHQHHAGGDRVGFVHRERVSVSLHTAHAGVNGSRINNVVKGAVGKHGLVNQGGAFVHRDEEGVAVCVCGHGFPVLVVTVVHVIVHVRHLKGEGECFQGGSFHHAIGQHVGDFSLGVEGHGDGFVVFLHVNRHSTDFKHLVDHDVNFMGDALHGNISTEVEHGFGVGEVNGHAEVGGVPVVKREVDLRGFDVVHLIGGLIVHVTHAIVHGFPNHPTFSGVRDSHADIAR